MSIVVFPVCVMLHRDGLATCPECSLTLTQSQLETCTIHLENEKEQIGIDNGQMTGKLHFMRNYSINQNKLWHKQKNAALY